MKCSINNCLNNKCCFSKVCVKIMVQDSYFLEDFDLLPIFLVSLSFVKNKYLKTDKRINFKIYQFLDYCF